MGSVYEVEHVQLGKRFVLKSLHREFNDRKDLVSRLRTEWLSLAQLHHPHIVTVTDAGTSEDGVAYFVMEKLEGETLSERLRRERPLAPPDALRIAREIVEGLAAAHKIDVVHRDVKPANVYLSGGEAVKLLDFGIAKVTTKRTAITAHGVAIGTPRYMSPEQARGESVDSRADLYAAALVLFEMLVGKGPFDSIRDSSELILAQMVEPAPRLSSLIRGIDPELDELCAAMLSKQPDERPASASAVVDALAEIERRQLASSMGVTVLPGSTQTTVPGALVRTSAVPAGASAAQSSSGSASSSRASASAGTATPRRGVLTPGAGGTSNADDDLRDQRTEALSEQAAETRTSVRAPGVEDMSAGAAAQTGFTGAPTSAPMPAVASKGRGSSPLLWVALALSVVAVVVVAYATIDSAPETIQTATDLPSAPSLPSLADGSPATASPIVDAAAQESGDVAPALHPDPAPELLPEAPTPPAKETLRSSASKAKPRPTPTRHADRQRAGARPARDVEAARAVMLAPAASPERAPRSKPSVATPTPPPPRKPPAATRAPEIGPDGKAMPPSGL